MKAQTSNFRRLSHRRRNCADAERIRDLRRRASTCTTLPRRVAADGRVKIKIGTEHVEKVAATFYRVGASHRVGSAKQEVHLKGGAHGDCVALFGRVLTDEALSLQLDAV